MNKLMTLAANQNLKEGYYPPFQTGYLEELYPDETFEQIKARRLSNWQIFKSNCDLRSSFSLPPYQIVEMWQPDNEFVHINEGKRLTIYGEETEIIFYPFIPTLAAKRTFEVEYNSTLRFSSTTYKLAERRNLFESYNCVLKKGTNAKQIELLGTLRFDFWETLEVGQLIYYSWSENVLGETNTVASFNPGTGIITLVNDISASVSSDQQGPQVWFGTDFKEQVTAIDYVTFGRHWVRGQQSPNFMLWTFINSVPANSTGIATKYVFNNVRIENFNINIQISQGNFGVDIFGTLEINYAEVGFSAFARGQVNNQYVGSLTKQGCQGQLIMRGCGLKSVGSLNFISSQNIYGSGTYFHPQVIVNLNAFYGYSNLGSTFRMYSTGTQLVNPGAESWIGNFYAEDSGELDLSTTISMPLEIDTYFGLNLLSISGSLKIHKGKINRWAFSVLSTPPDETPVFVQLNNCEFFGRLTGGWGPENFEFTEIEVNNSIFWITDVSAVAMVISDQGGALKSIKFNNCQIKKPAGSSIGTFVPGTGESGNPASPFIRPINFQLIEFDNLITDLLPGYFLLSNPDYPYPPNNAFKIIIKNSQLNYARLRDPNGFTTIRSWITGQINGEQTIVQGFNAFAGYNYPLDFTPKPGSRVAPVTASMSIYPGPQTIANVLQIDWEHNEYQVNGPATINMIAPVVWFGGSNKVNASNNFKGSIVIHAVGGDVTINPWNGTTNEYGNVSALITIPAGTSNTIVCDNLAVIAKDANSIVNRTIGTGDGMETEFKGSLFTPDELLAASAGFEVVAGAVTGMAGADGKIIGAGIDPESFIDYWTGTYYILFTAPVPNLTDVEVQYEKFNQWRASGIWSEQV